MPISPSLLFILLCTSYFVIFQLQLKCTWSRVSPKLRFCCRGIVDIAPSASHLPCRRFRCQNFPLHGWSEPPSNMWFLGPTWVYTPNSIWSVQLFLQGSWLQQTNWQTDTPRYSVCKNRPHLQSSQTRPNSKLCNNVVTDGTNQSHNTISMKFMMSIHNSLQTFWTPLV